MPKSFLLRCHLAVLFEFLLVATATLAVMDTRTASTAPPRPQIVCGPLAKDAASRRRKREKVRLIIGTHRLTRAPGGPVPPPANSSLSSPAPYIRTIRWRTVSRMRCPSCYPSRAPPTPAPSAPGQSPTPTVPMFMSSLCATPYPRQFYSPRQHTDWRWRWTM